MTTKRKAYKTYPKAFKIETVRLMKESDRPAAEIAMGLGIRRNQLYKGKMQMKKTGDVPSSKKGRPGKESQSELTTLV